jgi:formylglycine-generating enzyme required for sulfatase activity
MLAAMSVIDRSFRVSRVFACALFLAPCIFGCSSSSSSNDQADSAPADSGAVDTPPGDTNTLPFTPLTKVTAPGCADDPSTAAMVAVKPTDASKTFCIDATEVTVAQYQAFIDATSNGLQVDGQPKGCAFNDTYRMGSGNDDATLPVRNVDWCDAYMYCLYAGKRLCGELGGGSVDVINIASTNDDEWFVACTQNDPSTHPYPYGAPYQSGKCWDSQPAGTAPKAPKSMPDCKGTDAPYDGIFDMSGNVGEWEDSCQETTPGTFSCHVRGGGAASGAAGGTGCGTNETQVRSEIDSLRGFRCCADK